MRKHTRIHATGMCIFALCSCWRAAPTPIGTPAGSGHSAVVAPSSEAKAVSSAHQSVSAQRVRPPAEEVQAVAKNVLERFADNSDQMWGEFQLGIAELQGMEGPGEKAVMADMPHSDEFRQNIREYIARVAQSLEDADRVVPFTVGEDVRFVGPGEFPDCVGIGDGRVVCCTGTLVGRNVVLTAGHCLDSEASGCLVAGRDAHVFFGRDTGQGSGHIDGRWVPVDKTFSYSRPPEYQGAPAHVADLLVLILAEDQPEPSRPMATASQVNAAQLVTIVGFGSNAIDGLSGSGRKRAVLVPIMASKCSLGDVELGCHAERELVASREPTRSSEVAGACNGDSGGPAYIDLGNGIIVVAGAISRKTRKDPLGVQCGYGTVCVRVPEYEGWIRATPGSRW
jgi:hypothetical protein